MNIHFSTILSTNSWPTIDRKHLCFIKFFHDCDFLIHLKVNK